MKLTYICIYSISVLYFFYKSYLVSLLNKVYSVTYTIYPVHYKMTPDRIKDVYLSDFKSVFCICFSGSFITLNKLVLSYNNAMQ